MTRASEPFVSVMTPVYNTGDYLEQAIRSVLAQTHQNFEYLICENHSTDDSAEIAQRWAKTDSRIKVISPPTFLSQVLNYNFALSHISPESQYVKVVQADDWMYPQCLAEMVACGEAHPTTSVIGAYRLIETEGDGFGLPYEETAVPGRVACRLHLLKGIFLFGTPSSVMYRASAVRASSPSFYPLYTSYFDTHAVFRLLKDSDFGFVHQVLTFSRYQPGSITRETSRYYIRELDRVLILHHYGRDYLDEQEFTRHTARAWRLYYEGLGRQWLIERVKPRNEEFWNFHEKWLRNSGIEISKAKLLLGAAAAAARTALSPFDLIRDTLREYRPAEDPRSTPAGKGPASLAGDGPQRDIN